MDLVPFSHFFLPLPALHGAYIEQRSKMFNAQCSMLNSVSCTPRKASVA